MPKSGKHKVNGIDSFFRVRPSKNNIREGESISFLEDGVLIKQEKRQGVVYETRFEEQGKVMPTVAPGKTGDVTNVIMQGSSSGAGDITGITAGTGLTGGGSSGNIPLNVIGGTGITANADDIAIDSTVTTLTGSQTLTNKTLTSPVINTGVSGTAILDENDMSSDSDTKLATQQSIKAYVDSEISGIAAPANATITLSPGAGLAAIGDFTTNQSSNETLTIAVDGVLEDLDTLGAAASDGQFIVATGSGAFAYESGSTVRTSLGLGDLAELDTISDSQVASDASIAITKLAASSITVADGSSSTAISLGNTITFSGTSNEVTVGESSGTITVGLPDDVTIAGDLTVNGDVVTVTAENIVVQDPLIKLAKDNNSSDSLDIGFYGLYDTSGSQDLYAGLFRDANDSGKFKLFKDLQSEPTTTVNVSGTGYAKATLVADLEGNVTGNASGNAGTATKLANARDISLTGDITGVTPGAGFDGSAAVSIDTTIANDSVALGTKTTGNYVATITGGTGIDSNAATSGEGTTHTLSLDLSELTTSTSDGDGDFFAVVDSSNAQKKLTKGNINLSGFNNDSGFTSNAGTVTSVTVTGGNGLTGGGSAITSSGSVTLAVGSDSLAISSDKVDIAYSALSPISDDIATSDHIIFFDASNSNAVQIGTVSDLPFTTTSGTVTNIATENGITGGSITSTGTLGLDFSTLTDMTGDISGSTEFILQNGTTESRKAASEIKLSYFNNNSNWTSNAGTVTSVTAGSGMTQSGTDTVNPTLNVIGGTGITANANDITIDVDGLALLNEEPADGDTFIIYDDDASTIKKVAASNVGSGITVSGSTANGVLTYHTSSVASVESAMTFDGSTLILDGEARITEYLKHNGDLDTYLRFTDNRIQLVKGGTDVFDSSAGTYLHTNNVSDQFANLWTRLGYGDSGTAYWHKLCRLSITGSYKDYNMKVLWTSRYDTGTLHMHINSDNDNNIDIDYAYVQSDAFLAQSGNVKSNDHFTYVSVDASTVDVWIYTPAWREFDYIRVDSITEGTPSITFYDESTTTQQTSDPGGTSFTKANVLSSNRFVNGSNNRVLTAESADTFRGESNLTFDGTDLKLLGDDLEMRWGAGQDFKIYVSSDDAYLVNVREDKDIRFMVNDGNGTSGANITALKIDASDAGTALFSHDIKMVDSAQLMLGSDLDLRFQHDNSNAYMQNNTGDIIIKNNADDKDIILQSDDGSGNVTNYMQIDGSEGRTLFNKHIRVNDSVDVQVGSSADLRLYHDGSNSNIVNNTGDLYLYNTGTQDKDIIFVVNDGGTNKNAIIIDASDNARVRIPNDDQRLTFGAGNELQLSHESNNNYIATYSGHLILEQNTNDADIILNCDNGSGGVTSYLTLDGSESRVDFFSGRIHLKNDGTFHWGSAAAHGVLSWDTGRAIVSGLGTNNLDLKAASGYQVVVNESQSNVDFRVESDTIDDLLFCDASTSRVGIGETSLDANLHITGSPVVLKLERPGQRAIRMGTPDNSSQFVIADSDDLKSNQRYLIDSSGNHSIYGNTSFSSPMSVQYGAVFNEGSHDSDFRVESNGKTNAIHVDAGADKVNIDAAFWSNYGHRIGGLSQQGGFTTGTNQYFTTNNIMTFADNTNYAGAMVINTNITRASARMCTINVKGYGYGNQSFIDFDVNFYTYSGVNGQDGVAGYPYAARINDRGNDKKKKFVGINSSGNVAIAIGDYNDANKYYYGFKVSLDNHLNGSGASAYQSWTVTQSTTDGFGWLHKEEPTRQVLGIATQDASYTKILNPNGSVSMYLGGTADGNNYYQAGEHRFRNYAGSAYYARIGSGYIRGEGGGSAGTPCFSFQSDTNTGVYSHAADQLGFSTGGTNRMILSSNGLAISRNANPDGDANMALNLSGSYGGGIHFTDTKHSGIWCLGNGTEMHFGVGGSSYASPGSDQGLFMMEDNGDFHADEDVIAFSSSVGSDKKFKKNIKDTSYGLSDVMKMRAVEYDWIEKRKGKHDIGVIAQEIEEIIPEVVQDVKSIGGSEGTHKVVDYGKLASVLIKAIQEQQQQINELKEKLNG